MKKRLRIILVIAFTAVSFSYCNRPTAEDKNGRDTARMSTDTIAPAIKDNITRGVDTASVVDTSQKYK